MRTVLSFSEDKCPPKVPLLPLVVKVDLSHFLPLMEIAIILSNELFNFIRGILSSSFIRNCLECQLTNRSIVVVDYSTSDCLFQFSVSLAEQWKWIWYRPGLVYGIQWWQVSTFLDAVLYYSVCMTSDLLTIKQTKKMLNSPGPKEHHRVEEEKNERRFVQNL